MTACSFAACSKPSKRSVDGWDFCWGHYCAHMAEFHPKPVGRPKLKGIAGPRDQQKAQEILRDLASADWTVNDLTGRRQYRELIKIRHLAMYLIRQETSLSLMEIGDIFCRDHTTVLAAIQNVRARLAQGTAA